MHLRYLSIVVLILLFPANLLADECVLGDCENGYGKIVMNQGFEYEGEFKDGNPHGKGTVTTLYGTVITGDNWSENGLTGHGEEIYADGRKYVGEFKETKYNGIGTDTYPDGRIYTGEFKNAHPHGKGKLTNADGSVYEGDFLEGHPHGKGVYTYPDGSRYEGEMKNGGPDGYGIYYGPDGEPLFDGQWVDGEEVK